MSSSKTSADSKTTTTSPATPPKKDALDTPPPYLNPVTPAICSSGLIDFSHLSTLTAEQLVKFDEELVPLCRRWMARSGNGMPMQEFRDWLRGYGFFVSMDRRKYRQRAAEEGVELGVRLAAMVAFSVSSIQGDGVSRTTAFWSTVRELVEVRGLSGKI
ncbi:uncharacterized protein H6S33_004519 [Morchella sextelata]|uniref:uncharacterized protein n=1 Tax=Morchella sextelata TaxID=1174677 RepID=UPI001D046B0F|nr:uncharacterized protein H6S33_004519 [Morchella sextelata]KAH0606062.1 hypothetical protein H6S33_004519 [Morchella sextelata]